MLPDKTKPAQPRRLCRCFADWFGEIRRRILSRRGRCPAAFRAPRRASDIRSLDGAGELGDLVQVILRLIAVALFELPQAVILPGPHVVRIGLAARARTRSARPCSRRACDRSSRSDWRRRRGRPAERLQLLDRGGIVVTVVDRRVGGAIAGERISGCRCSSSSLAFFLLRCRCIRAGGFGLLVVAGGIGRCDGRCDQRRRQ